MGETIGDRENQFQPLMQREGLVTHHFPEGLTLQKLGLNELTTEELVDSMN